MENGLLILKNHHSLTNMNKLFNILVEFVFKLLFLTFSTIGVWSHWCDIGGLIVNLWKVWYLCSTGVYSILLYTINSLFERQHEAWGAWITTCLACYVMTVYYCNVWMFNSTHRIGSLKQRELGKNRLATTKKCKHE